MPPLVNEECVKLLDGVFDLATEGKVQSVAIVMVTAPGVYRIVAAGSHLDGMCEGAKAMHDQLQVLVDKQKQALAPKTVLHNQ